MPTGSSKSKESVYITVEALGVQQASENVKSVVAPLQQLTKGMSGLSKSEKDLNKFTNQVRNSISSTGKLKSQLSSLSPVTKTMSASFADLAKSGSKGLDTFGKLIGGSSGIGQAKGVLEGVSAATSGLSKGMLVAGGAVAGVSLAIAGMVKGGLACIDAYKELNPKARTYKDIMSETTQTIDDTKTAVMALAGESLNNALNPALESVSKSFTNAANEAAKFLSTLMSFDKKNKQSGFATMVQGTIGQTIISAKKFFGMDTKNEEAALNDLAEGYYNTRKESENKLEENVKKAQEQRKKQAKNHVKDVAKATKDEYADLALDISTFVHDPDSGDIWYNKLLDSRNKLTAEYASQMSALDNYSGDDEVKNKTRLKLEEDYQKQLRDLKLENARATNDQEYIVHQEALEQKKLLDEQHEQEEKDRAKELADYKKKLDDELAEEQRKAAEELAEGQKQLFDFMQSNLTGPLTSGVLDLIDAGLEGTEDMREASFNMFQSLAKNMFNQSITTLIESGIKAAAGQLEGNAKFGLPGIAMAAVASGIIAGTIAIYKSKIKPAKVQYATGGYISAGMVRGAGGSGDSVEALLQPGERVLSKEETKRYDKGNTNLQPTNNITINFVGQITSQSQLDTWTRQSLLPSLNRALGQGYKLAT